MTVLLYFLQIRDDIFTVIKLLSLPTILTLHITATCTSLMQQRAAYHRWQWRLHTWDLAEMQAERSGAEVWGLSSRKCNGQSKAKTSISVEGMLKEKRIILKGCFCAYFRIFEVDLTDKHWYPHFICWVSDIFKLKIISDSKIEKY